MLRELEAVEPQLELVDRHLHEVGDGTIVDLHPRSFFPESRSVAFGAYRLATITAHHDTILDLVLVLLHHFKESIDANSRVLQRSLRISVSREPVPQLIFLLWCEVIIRCEDGEVELLGSAAESLLPFFHLLPMPALYTTVVDRQGTVGDDETLINTDDTSKAFTHRTGTGRRVE